MLHGESNKGQTERGFFWHQRNYQQTNHAATEQATNSTKTCRLSAETPHINRRSFLMNILDTRHKHSIPRSYDIRGQNQVTTAAQSQVWGLPLPEREGSGTGERRKHRRPYRNAADEQLKKLRSKHLQGSIASDDLRMLSMPPCTSVLCHPYHLHRAGHRAITGSLRPTHVCRREERELLW